LVLNLSNNSVASVELTLCIYYADISQTAALLLMTQHDANMETFKVRSKTGQWPV